MQKLTSGLFAAALIVALPMTASAQDAAAELETPEVCEATVAPIQASSHVATTATFTEPFGAIVAIDTPAESGISLVTDAKHGEMAEMADEAEGEYEEKAEEMVEDAEEIAAEAEVMVEDAENTSLFWLNAENTPAGTYEIVLINESDESCTAQITVEG